MPKLSTVQRHPTVDEFYDGITEHETRGSVDVRHASGDRTMIGVAVAVAASSPNIAHITALGTRCLLPKGGTEETFDVNAYVPVDVLDGLIAALQGVVARARTDGVLPTATPRIA
jgi:hypothetical protein